MVEHRTGNHVQKPQFHMAVTVRIKISFCRLSLITLQNTVLHRLKPHTTLWLREWFGIHFLMTEGYQGLYYCSVQALPLLSAVPPQLNPHPNLKHMF
jgi:hypothetical protein